jgi:hypothetical protein
MKKLLLLLIIPFLSFGQQSNYSMHFDGENDYIDLGENLYNSDQGTIMCWMKFEEGASATDGTNHTPIFSQAEGSSFNNGMRLAVLNNQWFFVVDYRACSNNLYPSAEAETILNSNTWYHLAVTSNGDNWQLYINGEIVTYVLDSGTPQQNGEWFSDQCEGDKQDYIGRWQRSISDDYFLGKIDDFQIWDIPLSVEQINNYMNCPPIGIEDGLVGYWNFDNSINDLVFDLSSNENHGSIFGATSSEDVPLPKTSLYNCDGECFNDIDNDGICDQVDNCLYNEISIEVTGQDLNIGWNIAQDNGWALVSGGIDSFNNICIEDGCYAFNMYASNEEGWLNTNYLISYTNTDITISSGGLTGGVFQTIDIQIGSSSLCPVYGCSNLSACNYNPDATEDDGSCDYSCYCDTIYVDNFITDTIYVDNLITDTLYIDNFITDTIVETEYVEVIITEYIDCDSGLPCTSGIGEIIDKSKTDGKIYNLLGQEVFRREGIYIEGGEIKYRFQ